MALVPASSGPSGLQPGGFLTIKDRYGHDKLELELLQLLDRAPQPRLFIQMYVLALLDLHLLREHAALALHLLNLRQQRPVYLGVLLHALVNVFLQRVVLQPDPLDVLALLKSTTCTLRAARAQALSCSRSGST